jgi:hypothetical protein
LTTQRNWKPGVPKHWLYLLSGLIWCGVGLMLMRWTWIWSSEAGWREAWPYDVAGLVFCLGTATFFALMAGRNHDRITALPRSPCLFAFQSWWSYPLVVFMIGLGLALKASPLPRTWLAGIYLAIGGGLFLAGSLYFVWLVQRERTDRAGSV